MNREDLSIRSCGAKSPAIGVLAIGEPHQLLHVLGPAAELSRAGLDVCILVTTDWHEAIIARFAPDAGLRIKRLIGWRRGGAIGDKIRRKWTLYANLLTLRRFDILLTPEMTSSILRERRLFGGMMVHVMHGAGDREVEGNERARHFDLVLVAGEKTRAQLIALDHVRPETCVVAGYPKFDLIDGRRMHFFDDTLPVVLYNPHFRDDLSSWPAMGAALVRAFAEGAEFNLIVAPHIRLSGAMRAEVAALAAGPLPANIRVDPGSLHSITMDYTNAADIYLGDVSSQVYEFLRRPRPCVFLDPNQTDWQDNAFYRHWAFGRVATSVGQAMDLLRSAVTDHADHRAAQVAGFDQSICAAGAASARIARAVLAAHARRHGLPAPVGA
ncbi:MAG: hypothetical protein CVT84_02595 [Alphaproteobacteria bacterium HGW-Alphaproteobacteria-6]|nr:MAG: hypothetical protein CVT84_02595 [Alphaproteobacteria bacterium HGW-Alphaproteobacteria-6]